jgi:hypothetical protein
VDFPIENGDFLYSCVSLPEGKPTKHPKLLQKIAGAESHKKKSLHRLTSDDDWMEFGADGAIVEHGKVNIEN